MSAAAATATLPRNTNMRWVPEIRRDTAANAKGPEKMCGGGAFREKPVFICSRVYTVYFLFFAYCFSPTNPITPIVKCHFLAKGREGSKGEHYIDGWFTKEKLV